MNYLVESFLRSGSRTKRTAWTRGSSRRCLTTPRRSGSPPIAQIHTGEALADQLASRVENQQDPLVMPRHKEMEK
jgi:hypothetical protein